MIFRITADNETFTGDLTLTSFDRLPPTDQFEDGARPQLGNLLVAAKESRQIYEINPSDPLNDTHDRRLESRSYEIGGLGAVDVNGQTHIATDRGRTAITTMMASSPSDSGRSHKPSAPVGNHGITPTEVSVGAW